MLPNVWISVVTYYKPKNASARGSSKNESASMCSLMGPDILENPRRAEEPNPLADFFNRACWRKKKVCHRARRRILESTHVK